MSNCVLAVDIGTTALKAAVISIDGAVLNFSRIDFSSLPPAEENKFSEKWIYALKEACKKMENTVRAVKAVCISGNGPTLVFSDGTTLLWNEQGSQSPADVPCPEGAGAPDGVQDPAGIPQPQLAEAAQKSIFIPRLLLAKELYPALWQNTVQCGQKIFGAPEYLINKICSAEYTVLPAPAFKSAYWSREVLAALKIPQSLLCPFAPPGTLLGTVNARSAEEFGLPEGIPVTGGGPDFTAALAGTNTLSPGTVCDRAGSSEGINLCTKIPVEQKGIRCLPSIVEGLWNLSYLIPDPGKTEEEKAERFKEGISVLKKLAEENSLPFGNITITGGQARLENLVQKKADRAGIKISVLQTADAELLGDAAFVFTALGDFRSIKEACDRISRTEKTFCPKAADGETK